MAADHIIPYTVTVAIPWHSIYSILHRKEYCFSVKLHIDHLLVA
jgi:hypothetical protein